MTGLISLRLPDDLLAKLTQEADQSGKPRSEIVRDAVSSYLAQLERERFLDAIARAARFRGPDEALALAEEALPFDNEALGLSEGRSVRERRSTYRVARKKRR
ncbi:MAG TPA: ribbon-helix-helix domain-containing protein [Polyangiaceae bacterium]